MAVSNDFGCFNLCVRTNLEDNGVNYSSAQEAAKSGGVNTTEILSIKETSHVKHVRVILEETVEKPAWCSLQPC